MHLKVVYNPPLTKRRRRRRGGRRSEEAGWDIEKHPKYAKFLPPR